MLERGRWWISPETVGKPPAPPPGKKPMPAWLKDQDQPVRYRPRPDHTEGLLDLFASVHGHANPDGLYRVSIFDQAAIITASAVGGGSMIYSNVTIAPPADVLTEIGLSLSDADLAAGAAWMADFRGPLNRVVTNVPLPGRDVSSLGAAFALLELVDGLVEATILRVPSTPRPSPGRWRRACRPSSAEKLAAAA
jgi:hypothetical protein